MTDRNLQQSDLIWKQVVVVAAVGRLWMRVGVVVVGEGMYEARRGNQSCRLLHLPPIGFSTLATRRKEERWSTDVPAVRMGFKAGKRIEFLDDRLVMRCLDLGNKSSCLRCCFLS